MKTKYKQPLVSTSVRVDGLKLAQVKKLGIDLGVVFRKALDGEITRYSGFCPTCGRLDRRTHK